MTSGTAAAAQVAAAKKGPSIRAEPQKGDASEERHLSRGGFGEALS